MNNSPEFIAAVYIPLRGCLSERPSPAGHNRTNSKNARANRIQKSLETIKGKPPSMTTSRKTPASKQHRPQWEPQPRHTPPKQRTTGRAASGGRVRDQRTFPRHIKTACIPCMGVCRKINRKATPHCRKIHNGAPKGHNKLQQPMEWGII